MGMSVSLIYPPSYFETGFSEPVDKLKSYRIGGKKMGIWPPLGLLYLAAVLEKQGIETRVVDAFAKGLSLEDTINLIEQHNSSVVGISATTLQIRGAVQLAKALKQRYGDEVVVGLGGPHISADPDFINHFPYFDFGLIGEGEVTFPKLVGQLLKGEKVKGLHKAEFPSILNDLPFPARHLLDKRDYFDFESPLATIITSRGCPFRCLFCSRAAISDRVRFLSPRKAVDEIELIKDEYNGTFAFVDDTFTLKRPHTLELCSEIANRKLDIRWSCNTKARFLDEELLRSMKRAGCQTILIGVESGSERVRNQIVHKDVSNEEIIHVVKLCKKIGIEIGCYLMVGFPTETKEELKQTEEFAINTDVDVMSIHSTTIYPGSDLMDYVLKEEGVDLIREAWYRYARGEAVLEELPLVYVPRGLTLDELKEVRKRAYMRFYFRPKFVFKRLANDIRSINAIKVDILTAISLLKHGKTSKDLV